MICGSGISFNLGVKVVRNYYAYIYAVVMNCRDQYEIIWLCEVSHFIKQFCRNFCLDKAL